MGNVPTSCVLMVRIVYLSNMFLDILQGFLVIIGVGMALAWFAFCIKWGLSQIPNKTETNVYYHDPKPQLPEGIVIDFLGACTREAKKHKEMIDSLYDTRKPNKRNK